MTPSNPLSFHALAKPIGPICNIDCSYCYYLEKEHLYPDTAKWRMPLDTLEQFIRQYIQQQDVAEINFAWQGGEPTLLGVDFFRTVVSLQQRYASGKTIHNALQTNGTLIDDDWAGFLAEQQFLVGLSIDGPAAIHDHHRLDRQGNGTFTQVMAGLETLQRHRVQFNTLTVVGSHNQNDPRQIYSFLKQIGSTFIQFIPLVERDTPAGDAVPLTRNGQPLGRREQLLAGPPQLAQNDSSSAVTPWSVEPHAYGEFLCTIFDEWVRADVGRVFVQLFDVALARWLGLPPGLCYFAETCGNAVAVEHNGDVYSCDHYVYPQFKLGNLLGDRPLGELITQPLQLKFGQDKRDTLPDYCRQCDVRFACNGECPKHRFTLTPDGQPGLNYLCPAYKRFFHHVDPHMRTMAQLLKARRPAAEIMRMLAPALPITSTPKRKRDKRRARG